MKQQLDRFFDVARSAFGALIAAIPDEVFERSEANATTNPRRERSVEDQELADLLEFFRER